MPLSSLASILSKSINSTTGSTQQESPYTGLANMFQPASQAKSPLETAQQQNIGARETLESLGIQDPTKKQGPSVLERLFGPWDVLGAGVRSVIHNVTTQGTNVNPWTEMGKALKGEHRLEWSDILSDYGVKNKWVRMIGGVALDILTDPITYVTAGLPKAIKAVKSSMSVMLSDDLLRGVDIAAKWGDDVVDALGGATRITELSTQQAARLNEVLLSKASAGWHVGQEVAEDGSKVLRLLQSGGPTSSGGIRWMGIPLVRNQPQLNKLAAGTKEVLRGLPGSELFERAFIHGAKTPTFRRLAGNEPALDVVRRMAREKSAAGHVADIVGDAIRKELEKMEPDPKMRDFISLAISDQFADNLDEIAYRFGQTTEALNRRRNAFRQLLDIAGVSPGEHGGNIDEMINAALKRLDDLEGAPFSKATGEMTAKEVVEAGKTEVGGATRYVQKGIGVPVDYEELPSEAAKAALTPERQAELAKLQERASIIKDRLKGSDNYYKNAKAKAKLEAEEAATFEFGDEAGAEFAGRVTDKDVDQLIQITKESGGATYDPVSGRFLAPGEGGDRGIAMVFFPHRGVTADDLTPEQVRKFIAENSDLLEQNNLFVGTYLNDSGKIDIDVSTLLPEDLDEEVVKNLLDRSAQESGFRFSDFGEIRGKIGEWTKAHGGQRPTAAQMKEMGAEELTDEQILDMLKEHGVGGKEAIPMPKATFTRNKTTGAYEDASHTVQILQDSQRHWFLDIVDDEGVLWNYPEHFGVGGRSYNTLKEARDDADNFIQAVVDEVNKFKGISQRDYEALGVPKKFARMYGIEPKVSTVERKVSAAGSAAAGAATGFGLAPTPRPKRNTFAWGAWLDAHPEKASLPDERELVGELNSIITRMGQIQARSDKRMGGLAAQAPRRIRELTDEIIRASRAAGRQDLKVSELTRAISRYFEADDSVREWRVALNELLDGIGREDNVRAALERVGIKGPELENAMKVYKRVESQYSSMLEMQQKAGLDVSELFGSMGGERTRPISAGFQPGYQPSLAMTKKDRKAAEEAMRGYGLPEDIVRRRMEPEGYARTERMTPLEDVSKVYMNEHDRLLGITIDDRLRMGKLAHGKVVSGPQRKISAKGAAAPLETELDVAQQAGRYTSQALKSLGSKEYADAAARLAGDDNVLLGMLMKAEPVFTSDVSMRGFLRYYDKVLNVWKRAATVWNLPFFPARNKLSNQFLMWVDNALDPEFIMNPGKTVGLLLNKGSVKIGDTVYRASDGSLAQLVKRAQENRVVVGTPEIAELVGLGTRKGGPLTKAGGFVNQTMVEDADRFAAWISSLRKGLDDAAAAEVVDHALYNYAPEALTAFEREFMRRVVPFYTFARRNLPHMVETMVKTPGKVTWIGHLKETGQATQTLDESVMPDWMRGLYPIPLPTTTKAGMPLLVSTAGVLPFGDLEKLQFVANGKLDLRDALGQMSPLLKLPMELIFNKDLYYQSEISRYPGETRRVPGYIEQFDDLVGGIPVISDMWDAVKQTFHIVEKTDPETGEPYLAANAVAMKAIKDLNPWLNNMGKLVSEDPRYQMFELGYLTGVKTMPYDQQRFSEQQVYDDRVALQDVLQRLKDEGIIPKTKAKKSGTSLSDLIAKGVSR